jgi:hypothetical protein
MRQPISFVAECPHCHRRVTARTTVVLQQLGREHIQKCPVLARAKAGPQPQQLGLELDGGQPKR